LGVRILAVGVVAIDSTGGRKNITANDHSTTGLHSEGTIWSIEGLLHPHTFNSFGGKTENH